MITHIPETNWPKGMMPQKVETRCCIRVHRDFIAEKPEDATCPICLHAKVKRRHGCAVIEMPDGSRAFVCTRGD